MKTLYTINTVNNFMGMIYEPFGKVFEERYIGQGPEENRSMIETLDLGWELLKILPREELDRIDTKIIDKYLPKEQES